MGCIAGRPSAAVDIDPPPPLAHLESTYISKKGSFRTDYKIARVIVPMEHRRVLEVEHKTSKERFVLKEIAKDSAGCHKLLKEVKILTNLDHPNLIKLMEVYEDTYSFALVQELLQGGELFDYIVDSGYLNESIAATIMHQLLSAVAYCHRSNVVLRNIKPENILLATYPESPNDLCVKLVDFGMSTYNRSGKLHKVIGTELYTAPEVFVGEYDEACDVWSLGLVLYVMLSGTHPFKGDSSREIREIVTNGELTFSHSHWASVSPEAKELISSMLVRDPRNRISTVEAMHHRWVVENKAKDLTEQAARSELLQDLRKMQGENRFRQVLSAYLLERYSKDFEVEELRKLFESLDKDRSGTLSRLELIELLQDLKPTAEAAREVDEILQQRDLDKSMGIDYREFLATMASKRKLLSKETLEKAFSMLDTNQDGLLSVQELSALLGDTVEGGESGLKQLILQADVNHDGKLSLREFTNLLLQ